MKRRNFLTVVTAGSGGLLLASPSMADAKKRKPSSAKNQHAREMVADVIVAGGGMGGCATAIAACRNGLKVIMTEETDWIGGQVSQQGVPPDEHAWIETHGAPSSYRDFRNRVREYYKRNYPLTTEARNRENLNPGDGAVSRLCHEPKVAVAVLLEMLHPYMSAGKLIVLTEHKVKKAEVVGDQVKAIEAVNLKNGRTT